MQCLSCRRETTSKEAQLWKGKLLLCPGCAQLADKANMELEQAHRRAQEQAMMWLEQMILRGGLLEARSE